MTKLLSDILTKVPVVDQKGNIEIDIQNIEFDSRKVNPGDLFVAVRGTKVDGHKFIDRAIAAGAVAIISEQLPFDNQQEVCMIQVEDSSRALALIASAWYDDPSEEIKLTGITGTNGKTTIATLLYKLFKSLGYKAGLLSTIRIYNHDKMLDATHTTPDALSINAYLRQMVDAGCQYVFMEVSSHAIQQNRIYGLDFDIAVFSNITHDHLDYHKTFENYIKAKKKFFDELPDTAKALVNSDDRNASMMIQNTKADTFSFALKKSADYKAKVIENSFEGLQLEINHKALWARLVGDFNAYNLLAAYGVASLSGVEDGLILKHLSSLSPVEGRFEVIKANDGRTAIIDYAHTPDALENVVKTIKNAIKKDQQLIIVVGTGGDRDKTKRPVMARTAINYADKVILTSDNPRTEDPSQIINDMKDGIAPDEINNVLEIADRKQAIHTACMIANSADIVLVAGKGHETYQEVNGIRHHFDDKEVVRSIFNNS
ncbi:MAG: UDP-N-acetylmuramoyl-L-alanyl-D-glutamate--2,6-diaminopimelate ligase [Bacteroidales bacterium]